MVVEGGFLALRRVARTEFLGFLVVDILVGLVSGSAAWLLSGEPVTGFVTSLVFFGFGVLIILGWQIARLKVDVLESLGLRRALGQRAGDIDVIERIAAVKEGLDKTGDKVFLHHWGRVMAETNAEMRNMERDLIQIRVDAARTGEFWQRFIELVEGAQGSYTVAVQLSIAKRYFKGAGRAFYEANVRARERGVTIQRVLVVEGPLVGDKDLAGIVAEHKQANLHLHLVSTAAVGAFPEGSLGVIDRTYRTVVTLAPNGVDLAALEVSRDHDHVEAAKDRLDRILQAAEPADVAIAAAAKASLRAP